MIVEMKRLLNLVSVFVLGSFFNISMAQQDEQSSLYMFNPLQYNSAYAGSRDEINFTGVVRSQWNGIKGAPQTQFLSFNSPIKAKNMALGLNMSNDQIGARNRTSFFGDYAYRLNFKNRRKLNLGLSVGGEQLVVDFQKLIASDPTETNYLSSFSQFNFNVGFGAYYYAEKFFLGASIPRLLETKLSNQSVVLSEQYTRRHYFLTGGYVFPLNSVIDLKTSFLVKVTQNAPITTDLNANLFFYKTLWIGAMYRHNSALGLNVAYQIKESLTFGYAYDFPINGLSSVQNMGAHEIMLNYSINGKNKPFGSPRYF